VTRKIAIIGSGVAGLSAAYRLRGQADITLFEQDARPGGHANCIEVADDGRTLGIDTAFVVFNAPSYPEFTAFLGELDVAVKPHQGGFNFFDLDTGLQYGTAEFDLTEAEITARYPARFVRIWQEAARFHQEGRRDFFRKKTDVPLGQYLDERGYSEDFKHGYVVQLATAVWSVPPELIWTMPATTVIAFYMAHDGEGLGGRTVQWLTVDGGSRQYVRKVLAASGATVRLGQPVRRLRGDGATVTLLTDAGAESYDQVVVATHADDALALLAAPTPAQQAALAGIAYNPARVVLHTDDRVMPAGRDRWQSWNYGSVAVDGVPHSYVAYYMNRLHGFTAQRDFFATLDCPLPLREELVIKDIAYRHVVIDVELRRRQPDIYRVNAAGPVVFCGSYFHSQKLGPDQIGSHEAAFSSGVRAAESLLHR
jgi:predicted NAD/FAD-binding protein